MSKEGLEKVWIHSEMIYGLNLSSDELDNDMMVNYVDGAYYVLKPSRVYDKLFNKEGKLLNPDHEYYVKYKPKECPLEIPVTKEMYDIAGVDDYDVCVNHQNGQMYLQRKNKK